MCPDVCRWVEQALAGALVVGYAERDWRNTHCDQEPTYRRPHRGNRTHGAYPCLRSARRKVSFRIVDKAPKYFARSRGKVLRPRSLEALDDLSVVDQVLANGRFHLPFRRYDSEWPSEARTADKVGMGVDCLIRQRFLAFALGNIPGETRIARVLTSVKLSISSAPTIDRNDDRPESLQANWRFKLFHMSPPGLTEIPLGETNLNKPLKEPTCEQSLVSAEVHCIWHIL